MYSECMYSGRTQGAGRTYIYVLGTHRVKTDILIFHIVNSIPSQIFMRDLDLTLNEI